MNKSDVRQAIKLISGCEPDLFDGVWDLPVAAWMELDFELHEACEHLLEWLDLNNPEAS